ncbi:MarR family winged helix-turn-helix transcriptional regulator [Streptomyces hiroshimensis]|uniref:MarR family transcriptional regulator n=1 Tax=Streptomyces hiroshimensis TaxID=66424 RepID=A0ABQ2Z641_9ACTN|nr:MarR family transcriptional regulator [Streptomyces hiroshimensis]GGY02524.1 MarR family transcriptional regulator [Streptomyces hiroshimensis]
MSSKSRPELIESLMKAMRDQAGRGLMLHGAIAERFGLNFTDLKCLDLARSEPELTAGRIAAVTGLSTSAVTAVLDRLERRGFLERQRSAADRRKVVVVPTGNHDAEIQEIFSGFGKEVTTVLGDYGDEQLAFLLEVVQRLNGAAEQAAARITADNRN